MGVGQGGQRGRSNRTDGSGRDGADRSGGQAVQVTGGGHGVELRCGQGVGIGRREAGDLSVRQAGNLGRGQCRNLGIGQGTNLGRVEAGQGGVGNDGCSTASRAGSHCGNRTAGGQQATNDRTVVYAGLRLGIRNGENRLLCWILGSATGCVAERSGGCLGIKQRFRCLSRIG